MIARAVYKGASSLVCQWKCYIINFRVIDRTENKIAKETFAKPYVRHF